MIPIKLIIFILAMLVYAIAFVVKKLQEQAAIKRAKDDQARRRVDALRTGKIEDLEASPPVAVSTSSGSPAPLSHQEATRRLQDLAERRRQQLEELRRRAAAQGRAAAQSSSPGTPATAAAPVPQQVPRRPQPQARPAAARPAANPAAPVRRAAPRTQTVEPARRAPAKAVPSPSRRAAPAKRRSPEQASQAEKLSRVEADQAQGVVRQSARTMPASVPVVAPARADVAKLLIPTGKGRMAEWRRIIMLREVLARPVALRGSEFGAE